MHIGLRQVCAASTISSEAYRVTNQTSQPRSTTIIRRTFDLFRNQPIHPGIIGRHLWRQPEGDEGIQILSSIDFNKITEEGRRLITDYLDSCCFPTCGRCQLALIGVPAVLGIEYVREGSLHSAKLANSDVPISDRFCRFTINLEDGNKHEILGLILGRLVLHQKQDEDYYGQLTYWVVVLDTQRELWAFCAQGVESNEAAEFPKDDWSRPIQYDKAVDLFSKEDFSPVVKLGSMVHVRDFRQLEPIIASGVKSWTSTYEIVKSHKSMPWVKWKSFIPLVGGSKEEVEEASEFERPNPIPELLRMFDGKGAALLVWWCCFRESLLWEPHPF